MSYTYHLNKVCPICGVKLADKNKSGYCNKHRDRTGANNPFYGKKHSKETIDKLKASCKEASIKLWQNENYANNVKKGLKSDKNIKAHTSKEFRKKQSEHALQQMKDKAQLQIRSDSMKNNWETGKIAWHAHTCPNFSKDEIKFGEMLKNKLTIYSDELDTSFKIERLDLPKHYFCPDFKFRNFVIEFDGDFWHAHNRLAEDIVHHNVTAKEIWEKDELKNLTYKKAGFTVIRVWQSDFLADKEKCVSNIVKILLEKEENNGITQC